MRFRALILVVLLARFADAQTPSARRVAGTTVKGVVRDSIARVPLAGAIVQLVAADPTGRFGRTALSDSLGQFALDSVPEGRYTLGFFHPKLDSLGLEPTLRQVNVEGGQPIEADLAIPSRKRLRAAICGERSVNDSGGVVMGFVRDALNLAPLAGVTVTAEWLEVSFRPEGLARRFPNVGVTTSENGWFAVCNIPSPGTIVLLASRGADSTDLLEVSVPAEGFEWRELFLGPSRTVLPNNNTRRAGAAATAPMRKHTGDGRLSGTVVTSSGSRPVQDAQVSIANGPETRTDFRGEWTLTDLPAGTRTLEVRALGFYPDRRAVAVVANAPTVRVELSTLRAVLDTVKVRASRLRLRDLAGFQRRMRTGTGSYVMANDIARKQSVITSDLFRSLPGVHMEAADNSSEKFLLVRGTTAEWCPASIYLNGQHLSGISADDLDVWVHPNEIAGIEIYSGIGAPLDFQPGFTGCGSILIWTK